jgi:hypothetical protein
MTKRLGLFGVLLFLVANTAEASHIGFAHCATTAGPAGSFGPCTIDDKLFADLAVSVGGTDVSAFVHVASAEDGDLLRETLRFSFPVALPVGVSVATPLTIAYTVTALDPLFAIADIHLDLSAGTFGLVTETVTLSDGTVLILRAGTDPLTGFLGLSDSARFAGVGSIAVVKTITELAVGSGGTIDQAVTQRAVPEPGLSLLVTTSVLAIIARSRRTRPRHL